MNTFKSVKRIKKRRINIPYKAKEVSVLYANRTYRITEEQIKAIRNDIQQTKNITKKSIKILLNCNRILTIKGILVRMGKGKGKIRTRAQYLVPGTNCIIIQTPRSPIISKLINKLLKKYTFLSIKNMI